MARFSSTESGISIGWQSGILQFDIDIDASGVFNASAKGDFPSKRADANTLTGSLNHLAICARPDISLAVSKLSQFNQDATVTHVNAARRILKYVISTKPF